MGFRARLAGLAHRLGLAEKRSIESVPWNEGGTPLATVSADRALTLIPYFACVRLIGDQVSSLPLQTFRRVGDSRMRVPDPQLVTSPSGVVGRVHWLQQFVVSLATRGNAYGWIVARDGMGIPTQVEWFHPDEVYVDESRPMAPQYYWQGRFVPREDTIHIVWQALPGRVKGLSPVQAFARSIGIGLAATDYGRGWFENGGQPPGKFKNSAKTINATDADIVSERLSARIRSGRPLVYGSDWDYDALSATPEESQFLETLKVNATQMANIFGVPPEMVGGETGGSLTYNNPEMNGQALLKFCLRPWLVRFEDAFSAVLSSPRYVRFNIDQIVRADLRTRYEAHRIALEAGWLSVDEVRALEDLPPLPDGQGATYMPRVPPALTVPRDWPRALTGDQHVKELP